MDHWITDGVGEGCINKKISGKTTMTQKISSTKNSGNMQTTGCTKKMYTISNSN